MEVIVKIGAIFALVGLNAFFVAAEFALVGARSTRLRTLADLGDRQAGLALKAITHLDDYISGTQLGITLASLALGWIGEATLAELMVDIFHGFPEPVATLATHTVSGTIAFACITFLHIVLGELCPKSLALLHPEQVSRWVTEPLMLFTYVFWPGIWLLNKSANGFLRLFSITSPSHAERVHAPEELLFLLAESRKYGLVEAEDAEMIAGVLDLSRTSVRQAMTPRTNISAVERHWPLPRVIEVVRTSGHSRLPVYEDDLDHMVGVLLTKDLLDFFDRQTPFSLDLIMREPFFIPSTMQVDELLKELRRRNVHLAIVVDEYGGTLGLITLEDLLEVIVGEIFDEFDFAEDVVSVEAKADGVLSVSGEVPVQELNDALSERYRCKLPEGDYMTVAGLVLAVLGHVPTVGEQISVDGFTLQVTAMDGLRIDHLDITVPQVATEQSALDSDAEA